MQTSVFVSPNCLMVECVIQPSNNYTQNQNIFQPQQQLQNRKLIAFEVFSSQDMAFSPISGNRVTPPFLFNNLYMSFYTSSLFDATGKILRAEGLYYDKIPLTAMRRTRNASTDVFDVTSGTSDLFRMRPTEMDWTKSLVGAPLGVLIGTTTYSVVGLAHYLDVGDPGTQYM